MEKKQLEETLVQAIQDQSQERLNHLQADYDSQRLEIIDGYRREATEESNVFIDQVLAELKSTLVQDESQSKWQIKKDLFIKRTELVDALFEDIRQDLVAYTKTEAYRTSIQASLENYRADTKFIIDTIMVKADDVTFIQQLFKDKIKVEVNEHIHIGGFILKEASGLIEIDETLDYALKSQRGWFTGHSTLDF